MGGAQFAGVTQLLPLGVSQDQARAALDSMQRVLNGNLPSKAHESLKLARDAFAWKEYHTSTKFLLCAITNSIKQCMPDGWILNSAKPPNLLAPKSVTGERFEYLSDEMKLRDDLKHLKTQLSTIVGPWI